MILATKAPGRTREAVEKNLKESLERLGVTYIDLYQFHGINDFDTYNKIIAPNGLMAAVEDARKAGLIRHIGITSHSMEIAREAVKSDLFETIMFGFNFVTNEAAS